MKHFSANAQYLTEAVSGRFESLKSVSLASGLSLKR